MSISYFPSKIGRGEVEIAAVQHDFEAGIVLHSDGKVGHDIRGEGAPGRAGRPVLEIPGVSIASDSAGRLALPNLSGLRT